MYKQAPGTCVYWHKSNAKELSIMRNCPKCPVETVTDPTQVVYEDYYHPQVVQVVHHVEVVRRHHCVPVPQHIYTYSVRDEMCGTAGIMRSSSRR